MYVVIRRSITAQNPLKKNSFDLNLKMKQENIFHNYFSHLQLCSVHLNHKDMKIKLKISPQENFKNFLE